MCNKKWILYDNHWQAIQWLDWQEAPKHCLKPNLEQNKSWSLFGGLLPIWPTTASCISAKPLHLVSMLRKLRRCTENSNSCSQHWPTEWAQLSSTATPDNRPQNQGFASPASSTIFTWPLANQLHLRHLDNFFQEKSIHSQQKQKMLSKSLSYPETWIFMPQ